MEKWENWDWCSITGPSKRLCGEELRNDVDSFFTNPIHCSLSQPIPPGLQARRLIWRALRNAVRWCRHRRDREGATDTLLPHGPRATGRPVIATRPQELWEGELGGGACVQRTSCGGRGGGDGGVVWVEPR